MNELSMLINQLIDYLNESVKAAEELCGTDDEINYKPAAEALSKAERIKELLSA